MSMFLPSFSRRYSIATRYGLPPPSPAAALAANAARGHTAAGLEIHHSGVPVGAVADGPVEQA